MTYNEVGIGQGGFIKDGKVYFSAGYPPFHCKLHVYDLKTKEEVLCQELLPLRYEPEGIEIVGDKMYVVFWCSGGVTKIYEFKMPVLKYRVMFRVQPVQNVHMHQVVSLFRNLSADYCCGKP